MSLEEINIDTLEFLVSNRLSDVVFKYVPEKEEFIVRLDPKDNTLKKFDTAVYIHNTDGHRWVCGCFWLLPSAKIVLSPDCLRGKNSHGGQIFTKIYFDTERSVVHVLE